MYVRPGVYSSVCERECVRVSFLGHVSLQDVCLILRFVHIYVYMHVREGEDTWSSL